MAELPLEAQAALLRVLDGYPFHPLGHIGPGFLPNLRIIAMTNDRDKILDDSKFRSDLLFRLNGWHIHVDSISKRLETAKAIVKKSAYEMTVRDDKGKPFRIGAELSDESLDMVCEAIKAGKIHGGVRGIKSLVQRACIFGQMEAAKTILPAHVKLALVEELELIDRELRTPKFSGNERGRKDGKQGSLEIDATRKIKIRKSFLVLLNECGMQLDEENYSWESVKARCPQFDEEHKKKIIKFMSEFTKKSVKNNVRNDFCAALVGEDEDVLKPSSYKSPFQPSRSSAK